MILLFGGLALGFVALCGMVLFSLTTRKGQAEMLEGIKTVGLLGSFLNLALVLSVTAFFGLLFASAVGLIAERQQLFLWLPLGWVVIFALKFLLSRD